MRTREADIMRRWLAAHEEEYDCVSYNVRIGAGRDPGPGYADWVRKTAVLSSQLRMDAIAWRGDQATIIELKNIAFPDAVQELTVYGAVWQTDYPERVKPILLLVSRGVDAGTAPTAAAAGVTLEVLGFV